MTMHADHDTAIRAALAQVRDDMRAGVITAEQFDMRRWDCGTTACIGGWMERYLRPPLARAFQEKHLSSVKGGSPLVALGSLFHPQPLERPFHEAPAAIDRYLAGDEPWPAKETTP